MWHSEFEFFQISVWTVNLKRSSYQEKLKCRVVYRLHSYVAVCCLLMTEPSGSIWRLNRGGPRIDPCGTPHSVSYSLEVKSPRATVKFFMENRIWTTGALGITNYSVESRFWLCVFEKLTDIMYSRVLHQSMVVFDSMAGEWLFTTKSRKWLTSHMKAIKSEIALRKNMTHYGTVVKLCDYYSYLTANDKMLMWFGCYVNYIFLKMYFISVSSSRTVTPVSCEQRGQETSTRFWNIWKGEWISAPAIR